ncbi:MAG: glutamine synthetase, partial [Gammaproteobacteria bacterium]|nr:glutamine synthetase [Gammaproteobacteria bacterium]
MSASDVLNKINEYGVKFVDYRFTDTKGKEQHVTVPASTLEMDTFTEGKM